MGQDGINNRVINMHCREIQGYESLFEGTSFDAGYLDTVQRQIWMAITGGRVEYGQTLCKWEGIEEVIKPNIMIGVPCLRGYLLAPGRLKKGKVTPRIKLTVQRQALAYLMGNASGVGFGSVLWGQGRMIL